MRLQARIVIALTLFVVSTCRAEDSKETLARLFGKHERSADGRITLLERPNQELIADDLKAVSELVSLRQLNLAFCKRLKKEGLKHLQRLEELRELNLGGCKLIGDAGLEHPVR